MEPTFEPREPKGTAGPIAGIIIILLLLIAGAIYFWNVRQAKNDQSLPYIPGSESTTTVQ